jgi:hypothetical protein
MARKFYGGRALLNLPGHHSTAAIVAEIENTVDWEEGKGRGGDELTRYNAEPHMMLTVTDCDNRVNIELDIDSENSYENTIYKVDTMIEELRKLRKGLVTERGRYVKREKHIPKEKRFGI